MEYSVPQFIEVEDEIIGPLTLKQFLILLAGGLLEFALWSIFQASAVFFLFSLPVVIVTGLLAFGKFNGRSLLSSVPNVIRFYMTPKFRIFRRTVPSRPVVKETKEKEKPTGTLALQQQERVSRLRRLAYILDEKSAEEKRLITSGQMQKKWINQI